MDMKESGKANIKTSESSKPSLENDKEVKKWIETIKSHEWVKVIEGEEG